MAKNLLPSIREDFVGDVSTHPEAPSTGGRAWSARSLKALNGIHKDLRKVADLALVYSPVDFVITEGCRTVAKQREYVRKGASKTMKSRHLHGFAIDFVDYPHFSYDYDLMKGIADAFKKAAKELNIEIRWGGDWKSFQDTPHIELWSGNYPDP